MKYNHKLVGMALALFLAAGCSDSNEPTQTPAMSVTFEANTVSVPRGQSKTFPVTVSRSGGFTGSIVVSITGLPQDLTAGCSPASILGHSATLTVAAGATQALGTFTATVKATATGVTTQTFLLTINVTS